jgi:AcrR family transcriptional regulator
MATDAERVANFGKAERENDTALTRSDSTGADQRSRLLQAVVEIVARDGYAHAKIGDVAGRAGVSRPTFYELFADKEACLLSAQRELAERMCNDVGAAVAQGDASRAAQSALSALVTFVDDDPLAFDFLMHEAMLAGPRALAERDRLMRGLEHLVELSWEQAPADLPLVDMSPKVLLEGAVRLLGVRMRREGDAPSGSLSDLLAWIDSYTVSARAPRWRELAPHPALLRSPPQHAEPQALHRSLPKGRHRLSAEVVKSVQRERITYATAEAIRTKGYANVTVADIVATAGLSRDVFYAHFHDKEEAFEATVQLVFEQLLATMAGAFFGSSDAWPEQIWAAGWAFVRFLESNPSLAHFLFVGTYAPPSHIRRVHDFVLAFTVFVDAGNRYRTPAAPVPRIVVEAIVCSVLEAVNLCIRDDRVYELRGLIPIISYMVLAPFMGTDAACEFVEAKIAAAQSEAGANQPS